MDEVPYSYLQQQTSLVFITFKQEPFTNTALMHTTLTALFSTHRLPCTVFQCEMIKQ